MQKIFKRDRAAYSGATSCFIEQLQELIGLWKLELLSGHRKDGKESKQSVARSRWR